MNIKFESRFEKDLKLVKERNLYNKVETNNFDLQTV